MEAINKKLDKILTIVETFDRRLRKMQQESEHSEQLCTSTNVYVRRNNKRVEEAMKTIHIAFQLCCNAQYNLMEDLDDYAGTCSSEQDRVKIV